MKVRLSGALSIRPPATSAQGAYYLATDEGKIYESAGSAWIERIGQLDESDVIGRRSGTLAQRPSASTMVGWLYLDTDTGKFFEAFPSGWIEYAPSMRHDAGGNPAVDEPPAVAHPKDDEFDADEEYHFGSSFRGWVIAKSAEEGLGTVKTQGGKLTLGFYSYNGIDAQRAVLKKTAPAGSFAITAKMKRFGARMANGSCGIYIGYTSEDGANNDTVAIGIGGKYVPGLCMPSFRPGTLASRLGDDGIAVPAEFVGSSDVYLRLSFYSEGNFGSSPGFSFNVSADGVSWLRDESVAIIPSGAIVCNDIGIYAEVAVGELVEVFEFFRVTEG